MKSKTYLLGVFALMLMFSANLFAQDEMTAEEWQKQMNQYTTQKANLTTEMTMLKNQVSELKTTSAGIRPYEDCQAELYGLVGATQEDINNYRMSVDDVTSKINRQQKPKKDRQAELDKLKASKISALPEFYNNVHNILQRKLDAWEEKPDVVLYTVVRGDNLWNIAKKPEHYGNGFAWPKIYNANRDQIKNPDLIYPKQVFKIPSLTEEEKAKYDKIRRNYKPAPMDQ